MPSRFSNLSYDGEVFVRYEIDPSTDEIDPKTIHVDFITFAGIMAGKGFEYSADDTPPTGVESYSPICKNWYHITQ